MKNGYSISERIKNLIIDKSSIPENSVKISFSQYSIFKSCPHRWYLTYGKKLFPFTSSIDTVFGTALHETVQKYLSLLYNEGVKQSEDFKYSDFLYESLKKAYSEEKIKNNNNHFTTKEILESYYQDGLEIMRYLKKNRNKIFDNKNMELVGIEIPILTKINDSLENFWFNGYIDIVFYDRIYDSYLIIDVKSSKDGWKDYAKKDEIKINQLLLYKRFLSKQFGIPEDKINVEFMILKRKIWEDSPYPVSRVQKFSPANGVNKVNSAIKDINDFIHECYDYDGTVIEKKYLKTPGDKMSSCRFCPFNGSELCDKIN